MKLSKNKRQKLLECNNIKINFDGECDLCGYLFIPIYNIKYGIKRAECPNCGNIAYIK